MKAALAGVAGAGLLLGGAGSLAYWNDTETIGGTAINDGQLSLSTISCNSWSLNGAAEAFNSVTDLVSPGDVLKRVCSTTITAQGKHLTATLSVDVPALTGKTDAAVDAGLLEELTRSSTFEVATEAPVTTRTVTAADDQKAVKVTTTITFPYGLDVDNGSNNKALGAVLSNFPLTLKQDLAADQVE